MNPDTNRFEKLSEAAQDLQGKGKQGQFPAFLENLEDEKPPKLLRPDGTEVPDHWSIFTVEEELILKGYRFKVGYIGESALLLEPVGPVLVGLNEPCPCGSGKKFKRCCA